MTSTLQKSGKEVHLLCSSGGVRCFSYIGAYKELAKAGYKLSGVSASSMGSVIGMLICLGLTPNEIEEKVLQYPLKNYIRKRVWSKWIALMRYPYALYRHPDYEAMLEDFVGQDYLLRDLPIPYSTLALDLNGKQLLSINKDTHPDWKVSELLSVATAIPPSFSPIEIDQMLLVDGGVASESPGWVAAAESQGRPIVVFKCSAGLDSKRRHNVTQFAIDMVQAVATSHDDLTLSQMPTSITINIPCRSQRPGDFGISRRRIKELISKGEDEMKQILELCHDDLHKYISVENLLPVNKKAHGLDLARERNIALFKKYKRQTSGRHQVFISYSHKDIDWFNKLQMMLAPIEVFYGIKVWDDKEIVVGSYWREAIKGALAETKLAICLVSKNFTQSEFITANELKYFQVEAERQDVSIFPIAVSRISKAEDPFSEIQYANSPDIPLDELNEEDQHAVLSTMMEQLVETMRKTP